MSQKSEHVPGGFNADISRFELEYWETYDGVSQYDLHLATYQRAFPMAALEYAGETILDIGSGAVSVFEKLAPRDASIAPYDLLADDYNRIAPDKRFPIRNRVDPQDRFSLITIFNMIDHVVKPEEIMAFAADHLADGGRVWLAVHLFQPHGPTGHPQNYDVRSILEFVSAFFHIERCGVLREGIPHPYVWYGELSLPPGERPRLGWLHIRNQLHVLQMQGTRAAVKLIKLAGLRKLLPKPWRF